VACGKTHAPFGGSLSGDQNSANDKDGGPNLVHQTGPPPPPKADAGGLCGNQIVPVVVERPNFYFVLDASGSMSDTMTKPDDNGIFPVKYDAAKQAIADLLVKFGHRVSYGAALFPQQLPPELDPNINPNATIDPRNACLPGGEVFPTQPGDPFSYTLANQWGPVLSSLLDVLSSRAPSGLTPTAASLESVKKNILALKGKTIAFLLTDGAPNCNLTTGCSADACTVNIEGGCPPDVNCCDSSVTPDGYLWCFDSNPTIAAVTDLANAGVPTYIVGMPGTNGTADNPIPAYEAFLDQLAIAGKTAQAGPHQYYPVEGTKDLIDTLVSAGSRAISCDIKLTSTPPDTGLVNVYFDTTIVPFDAKNGWQWVGVDGGENTVRVVGSWCDHLRGGDVDQVQVVSGCPSETM
jgi:hypothetical protein